MSPYYGPIGESAADIFLEKTFLISGYLTGLGYGAQLVLYLACARILWGKMGKTSRTRKTSSFLLAYITILCILNTMWTGVSAFGLQATYIDNRNYPAAAPDGPGGPIAFLGVEFSLPFNIVGQIVFTAENLLADALLFWRCHVIWSAQTANYANYVMAFPALMFLGSLAMGIVFGIETASPNGLFGSITAAFGIPYFAISLSLNIILTLLIVGRIYHHQRSMNALFGHEQSYGRHYQLLLTMFIESAAMFSLISILLLITFALGNPINQIWLGVSPAIQLISSYLIILRVANGQQWTTDTAAKMTNKDSIVFNVPTTRGQIEDSADSASTAAYELRHVGPDKAMDGVHVARTVHTCTLKDGQPHVGWGNNNDEYRRDNTLAVGAYVLCFENASALKRKGKELRTSEYVRPPNGVTRQGCSQNERRWKDEETRTFLPEGSSRTSRPSTGSKTPFCSIYSERRCRASGSAPGTNEGESALAMQVLLVILPGYRAEGSGPPLFHTEDGGPHTTVSSRLMSVRIQRFVTLPMTDGVSLHGLPAITNWPGRDGTAPIIDRRRRQRLELRVSVRIQGNFCQNFAGIRWLTQHNNFAAPIAVHVLDVRVGRRDFAYLPQYQIAHRRHTYSIERPYRNERKATAVSLSAPDP
ncbi:hypothetical protein B0H10DRAFT_2278854 [Mycena sp. CBHHK59/15]|nr:hypothetical protein B0H10DRAFT_2278854 [Mycena sp. CBHHK59/15]